MTFDGTKNNITREQLIRGIDNYQQLTMTVSNIALDMVTLMDGENMRATMSRVNIGEVYDPSLNVKHRTGRGGGLLRRRMRTMMPMHRICLRYRLRGDSPNGPETVAFMTVLARDWESWG